ncbi:hypothetical protein HaLaN_16982, partial [Haematococcus lacustris]
VKASLAALGSASRLQTGLGPAAGEIIHANLGDATGGLPDDLRALALYISPDRSTLYVAGINIPDPAAASNGEVDPGSAAGGAAPGNKAAAKPGA